MSTDSEQIKALVEATGLTIPFLRPAELATDTAGTREVLMHALDAYAQEGYEADTLVLLQPTSPFRTATHLREALELYDGSTEMVVSVKETKANPYFVLFEENRDGWLEKSKTGTFARRQDCPPVWEYNGAIYIIDVATFRRQELATFSHVRKYVMDEFHSHDMDTPLDWEIGTLLLERQMVAW